MRIRRFRRRAFVTHRPCAARPSRLLLALLLLLPLPAVPQAPPDHVVIQAGTNVVLVNVVAKDKHGKPVDDLSRDDFVLRDNGQDQKITMFAMEKANDAVPAAVSNSPSGLTFTNRPGPDNPAVTAFLFDELNTQLADQELALSKSLENEPIRPVGIV
jgi:hypothetical protein